MEESGANLEDPDKNPLVSAKLILKLSYTISKLYFPSIALFHHGREQRNLSSPSCPLGGVPRFLLPSFVHGTHTKHTHTPAPHSQSRNRTASLGGSLPKLAWPTSSPTELSHHSVGVGVAPPLSPPPPPLLIWSWSGGSQQQHHYIKLCLQHAPALHQHARRGKERESRERHW